MKQNKLSKAGTKKRNYGKNKSMDELIEEEPEKMRMEDFLNG